MQDVAEHFSAAILDNLAEVDVEQGAYTRSSTSLPPRSTSLFADASEFVYRVRRLPKCSENQQLSQNIRGVCPLYYASYEKVLQHVLKNEDVVLRENEDKSLSRRRSVKDNKEVKVPAERRLLLLMLASHTDAHLHRIFVRNRVLGSIRVHETTTEAL
ncbi:unnamed protein product, partial [Amoebophrya sp. A25]|eukprot:GSA25T00026798001.1